jgi:hypothetical protein
VVGIGKGTRCAACHKLQFWLEVEQSGPSALKSKFYLLEGGWGLEAILRVIGCSRQSQRSVSLEFEGQGFGNPAFTASGDGLLCSR